MAREIASLYAVIAGGIGTPGMAGMPGIPRPMAAIMAACAPPGDKTPRYDSGDEPRRRISWVGKFHIHFYFSLIKKKI